MYSTHVVVQETSRERVPLLILDVKDGWQRLQRRHAVRVGVAVRPRIAARIHGDERKPVRLGITNVSATGVQVRSQEELRTGERIELAFELMGVDEELHVDSRVRRVYRIERGGHVVWDAGCEFEAFPDRLSRKIVQYIFAQQRAVARARKG
jgi:c-di-GMP-binding flagellar brake protein YcgR